jgi:hypothetical protein
MGVAWPRNWISISFPLGNSGQASQRFRFIFRVAQRIAITLAPSITITLEAISANHHDRPGLDADLQQLAVSFRRKITGYAQAALFVRSAEPSAGGSCASSLLVGSLPGPASVQLLIRAGCAGAFAQVAGELMTLAGQSAVRRPLTDLHLFPPEDAGVVGLAASEGVDASAVNQAIGALLDHGWLPDAAAEELDRLGEEIAVPTGVAARLFLRGLVNPTGKTR